MSNTSLTLYISTNDKDEAYCAVRHAENKIVLVFSDITTVFFDHVSEDILVKYMAFVFSQFDESKSFCIVTTFGIEINSFKWSTGKDKLHDLLKIMRHIEYSTTKSIRSGN